MSASIQTLLAQIQTQFADKRIHYCQIDAATVHNGRITLSGSVLDQPTLTAVTSHLAAHFPDHKIDVDHIQLLRQSNPLRLAVTTTITGLHMAPGFRSEPADQLLNGQVVEWLREEDKWSFVRQPDGYLGWMYRPYLGPATETAPSHLVCEPISLLRQSPGREASLVSRILAGTVVTCLSQEVGWTHIRLTGGMTGWIEANHIRPMKSHPQTEPARRQQLVMDAHRFIGTPYLWGGWSAFGLDCSGLVHLTYHLAGLSLRRDADMQFEDGRPVAEPFQPGDLLFFSSAGGHRKITHVGMSLGGWHMIHASRSRNGVYVDDVQTVPHLRQTFVGARTFI
jgi:hypothetical protein